jgi:hypothetical protein
MRPVDVLTAALEAHGMVKPGERRGIAPVLSRNVPELSL